MFALIARFFRTAPDAPRLELTSKELKKKYDFRRWTVFIGITLGYGFFYVARLSMSVVKKPIIDSGILDAAQLGKIGAILLTVYAFGKFFNGVLADRCNIKRFMSAGLILSAIVNLLMGFTSIFWIFFILWGLNGWFQAMGAAPSVVSLSQWFSKKERGTWYGIWYVSHSIGEGITFICTSVVVSALGWRYGFGVSGALGLTMGVILLFLLADRPETYGLPNVAEYKNEPLPAEEEQSMTLLQQQLAAMKYPAVWVLGLASALTYVARYGVNSWGVLYLQEVKHYSLVQAGSILGMSPVIGIAGGALSGFISDRFFGSNRHKTTLLYGLLQVASLCVFFFGPPGHKWLDVVSIAVFGFAVSGTVAFLGGLTAIDLTPRRVTGAVMGFIGFFSYLGASTQDWISGYLLEKTKTMVAGQAVYNFDKVIYFWVGAAALSLILAMTVWNVKPRED
ncbi:MAG TPA: MFS transporter [bacterium]|nr:MFS transporter [bacterium]